MVKCFMMHRPAVSDILKDNESYYALVIGVAKRARQIVDQAQEENRIIVEKPVQLAVEEFASGKYHFEEYHSDEDA